MHDDQRVDDQAWLTGSEPKKKKLFFYFFFWIKQRRMFFDTPVQSFTPCSTMQTQLLPPFFDFSDTLSCFTSLFQKN